MWNFSGDLPSPNKQSYFTLLCQILESMWEKYHLSRPWVNYKKDKKTKYQSVSISIEHTGNTRLFFVVVHESKTVKIGNNAKSSTLLRESWSGNYYERAHYSEASPNGLKTASQRSKRRLSKVERRVLLSQAGMRVKWVAYAWRKGLWFALHSRLGSSLVRKHSKLPDIGNPNPSMGRLCGERINRLSSCSGTF